MMLELVAIASWILGPPGPGRLPDVRSVSVEGDYAVVRSFGISLHYLGPLQDSPAPGDAPTAFTYRIPLHPGPAGGRRLRVGTGVIGAFLNGMPIWNQFAPLSYGGANVWHYDAVALRKRGVEPSAPGLLDELAATGPPQTAQRAPRSAALLIGFALDGYPIYAAAGAKSSYRLRGITQRHSWPDGTELTPEQYGPDVNAEAPLGTFAEDYEYVAGSGDLDESNGRLYNGGYGYFLTSGYPYSIGPTYYGKMHTAPRLPARVASKGVTITASTDRIVAGAQVSFAFKAAHDFEYVHEKPIHLLIASSDLSEFAHIHPDLLDNGAYQVTHTFARPGRYRLWADYSLAGEAPRVDSFDVTVSGTAVPTQPARPASSLRVKISFEPLRAGADIPITLHLSGELEKLEPYLGAWAHVVIVSGDLETYAHAHPVEQAPALAGPHSHTVAGPAPGELRVVTSFPKAGRYKLWAQFQLAGEVLTFPFDLRVAPGAAAGKSQAIPDGAPVIHVTQHGYDPPRLEIPAGLPVKIAFVRDNSPSCGSEVVFPALGIRKALAPNSTVVIDLRAQAAGEISFTCGMGMYRGMIISQYKTSKRSD